jgi:hypothetical protein
MQEALPTESSRTTIIANADGHSAKITYAIKTNVFRLDISVNDLVTVEIFHSRAKVKHSLKSEFEEIESFLDGVSISHPCPPGKQTLFLTLPHYNSFLKRVIQPI